MKRLIATALLVFASPSFAQHEGHVMPEPDAHPSTHQAGAPPVQAKAVPSPYPAPTIDSEQIRIEGSRINPPPLPSPAMRGREMGGRSNEFERRINKAEYAAAFPPELEGMDMSAHMDDNPLVWVLRGDELERGDNDTFGWDLRAGIGYNFDRLWLRSEGERSDGRTEHATTELLWSHATGPWWDRTLGIRHDSGGDGPSRDWLAVGVQGLAPYKFELEATGYIGESGRLAARLEGEYEVLLTNRLILQPKLEANLYSRDDVANRIGQGLSDVEFGLRLRYEFSPQFAPYLGYAWTRRFGETADLYEADGEDASEHGWVAGIRFWF